MAKKMPKALKKWARELASQGGKARAESLTPERRSEIARKAVAAREAKKGKK